MRGSLPALTASGHGCPPTRVDVVQAIAEWAEQRLIVFAIDGDGAGGVFDGRRGIG